MAARTVCLDRLEKSTRRNSTLHCGFCAFDAWMMIVGMVLMELSTAASSIASGNCMSVVLFVAFVG